jgi:hypothetical protein
MEQKAFNGAKEALMGMSRDDLIRQLIKSKEDLERERNERDRDDKLHGFVERRLDAVKEILWCVVYDQKTDGDPVTMANAARLMIESYRAQKELPF